MCIPIMIMSFWIKSKNLVIIKLLKCFNFDRIVFLCYQLSNFCQEFHNSMTYFAPNYEQDL